ncbi:MAG: hypothetical protein K2P85_08100 [Flavobacteriaceae bacterium]|nr:hypothetical protein [Flavobacteriaceae bacterium]
MKRIIAILTLSLAFSLSSNAQEAKKNTDANQTTTISSKETVLQNISDLTKTVKLDDQLAKDLTSLLFMREEAVNNARTIEEKKSLFDRFSQKLMGGLSPDQLKKLQDNKELYTRLTLFPVTK